MIFISITPLKSPHSAQVFEVTCVECAYICSAVCDYMGERLASLFGITTPKYQYAIDEYYRIKKEVEDIFELVVLVSCKSE